VDASIIMPCHAYILWSASLDRYYAGIAEDLDQRLQRHQRGEMRATSRTSDWKVVWSLEMPDYLSARQIEKWIKARGAARFLADEGRA
jgi:putative endonuclease